MKTWNVLTKFKVQSSKFKVDEVIDLLLASRGIKSKKDKDEFLNPKLTDVTIESVGIDKKELKKALTRLKNAIKNKEQIVVFGDYDVDGITGAAILWETLNGMGANILPYIPHRVDEGYGLSVRGIENIKNQKSDIKNVSLIITVDNGIVANEAVDFANKQGIDVIITDHHVAGDNLPKAHSTVHTTKLCGAGVAYLLAQELKTENLKPKTENEDTHLELAALGTIADLVPLTGANRTIVKHGLSKLCKTKRPGLRELFKQADLFSPHSGERSDSRISNDKSQSDPGHLPAIALRRQLQAGARMTLSVYEVGYIIAPRLNAAGRIESAMESLRLLCTRDQKRAEMLAEKLEVINRQRQLILKGATEHAVTKLKTENGKLKTLLFIAHESYQQGVIGLVAGKLVEKFYRPAIVMSIGEIHSKASARSITGFNMIEFLRLHAPEFVNVGGHPMAAGFTVETAKLPALQKLLEESSLKLLTDDILTKTLRIDCELPLSAINTTLYNEIQTLSPFGMGNPEPVFVSRNVVVKDFKLLGKDRNHLKLILSQNAFGNPPAGGDSRIDAIGFGMGEYADKIKIGGKIDIAYTIDENAWNGNTKLQLKIKDIKILLSKGK